MLFILKQNNMSNKNLELAKKSKNDEFYTQYADIEKEVMLYSEYLKGKVVYLNCDTENSNFYKFFCDNFNKMELKALHRTSLSEGFDFRDDKSIEILKQSDVVITNPPFSLFRDFIDTLKKYDKKFLIIGTLNAITYRNCFNDILINEMNVGWHTPQHFYQPDGTVKKFGNICWFTNINSNTERPFINLSKKYDNKLYPEYDNYHAIEVSQTKNIPIDYDGVMGVPVSFILKHNRGQFDLLGCDTAFSEYAKTIRKYMGKKGASTILKEQEKFKRLFIKWKK